MLSPRDDYVDNKQEKQNKGRGEEVERVFIFPPWTGEPGGFYIGLCERRGCSGALCQRCPVSLSPPLCLDAFETGREGMWPVEGASSGMNGFTF